MMITLLQLFFTITLILKYVQSAATDNLGQLNLLPGLAARYFKSTLVGTENSVVRRTYLGERQYLTDGTLIAQHVVTQLDQSRIIYKRNKLFEFYYDPSYHDMIVEFRGYIKAPGTGIPTFTVKLNTSYDCDSKIVSQQTTEYWTITSGLYLDKTDDGYLCTQNSSSSMYATPWADVIGVTNTITRPFEVKQAYFIEGKLYPMTLSLRVSKEAYTNFWNVTVGGVKYNLQDLVYYDPQDDFITNDANTNANFPASCPQFHDETFEAETFVEPTSIVPDGCPVTSSSSIVESSATSDIETSSSELPSSTISSSEIPSSIVSSTIESSSEVPSSTISSSEIPSSIVSSTDSEVPSSTLSSAVVSSTIEFHSETSISTVSSIVTASNEISSSIVSSSELSSNTISSSMELSSMVSSATATSDALNSLTSSLIESSTTFSSIPSSVVSSQVSPPVSPDLSYSKTIGDYSSSSEYTQSSDVQSSIPPVITSSSLHSRETTILSSKPDNSASKTDTVSDSDNDTSIISPTKSETELYTTKTLIQSKSSSSNTAHNPQTTIIVTKGKTVTATIKTTVHNSVTVTYTECPICTGTIAVDSMIVATTSKNDNQIGSVATNTKSLTILTSSNTIPYNPQGSTTATVLPFSDGAYIYTYEPLLLSLAFILAFI